MDLQDMMDRFLNDPYWRAAANKEGIKDDKIKLAAQVVGTDLIPISIHMLEALDGLAEDIGPPFFFDDVSDVEFLADLEKGESWVIANLVFDGWTDYQDWVAVLGKRRTKIGLNDLKRLLVERSWLELLAAVKEER